MQFLINSIALIAQTLLRLVLFAMAAIFALVLMCFALLGLVFVFIKAVLTGRKPELLTTFIRFRQASQQFKRGDMRNRHSMGNDFTATGTVIDVQAFEVHDDPALPHKPEDKESDKQKSESP